MQINIFKKINSSHLSSHFDFINILNAYIKGLRALELCRPHPTKDFCINSNYPLKIDNYLAYLTPKTI